MSSVQQRIQRLATDFSRSIGTLKKEISPQSVHRLRTTIRRVESLIAEALNSYASGSPNLAELAATARLSVNQFIRAFRRATGTTPHQLVMVRRCERAMDLLRQPTLTVADVSDAAGYSSPAHFVAAFRQRLGVTPGAYQRAVGGG